MCGIMFWLRRIDGSTCLVGSFASGLFAAGGMLRAVSTSGPRRVFISHTSELAEYPQSRPFVAAAVDGVGWAQDAPVRMKYFPAADQTPASVCTEQVQACGVFVGVIGFRYGSPVRDQPESSYVEWEFEAATRAGLTRLVFMIDDDAVGLPRAATFDREFDGRQQGFRRRLRDCGLTVQTVRSPEELELAVFAALRPPGGSGGTGSRRPTSVQFPGQVSSGEGAGPQRPASPASGKKPGELDKKNVFISYSHRDRKWLNRLLVHLKPLERTRKLDIWDDSKIKPGTPWKDEIDKALHSSQIAILLISADFLASDFISDNEVPQLLLGAQGRGTIVLPVIVSPSRFKNSENLSAFQAVNSPENPLTRMTAHKREEFFVDLASVVEDTLASFEDVTP